MRGLDERGEIEQPVRYRIAVQTHRPVAQRGQKRRQVVTDRRQLGGHRDRDATRPRHPHAGDGQRVGRRLVFVVRDVLLRIVRILRYLGLLAIWRLRKVLLRRLEERLLTETLRREFEDDEGVGRRAFEPRWILPQEIPGKGRIEQQQIVGTPHRDAAGDDRLLGGPVTGSGRGAGSAIAADGTGVDGTAGRRLAWGAFGSIRRCRLRRRSCPAFNGGAWFQYAVVYRVAFRRRSGRCTRCAGASGTRRVRGKRRNRRVRSERGKRSIGRVRRCSRHVHSDAPRRREASSVCSQY